ncbi:MAG: integration host factor subunit beta [Deltaproteobacteria bacterium HGW-Deltaproteobacteria-11]|nr:MAG: integration host factor subunit beta [Deltaproteobacteria bacterium HGW-Deltaproteobacteria-11]
MTKKDLIRKVQNRLEDCPSRDVAFAVNIIFAAMTEALKNDERIDVRGFGSFTVRRRHARKARNPRSGDPVYVEARRAPFFKMGKDIKKRMNTPE